MLLSDLAVIFGLRGTHKCSLVIGKTICLTTVYALEIGMLYVFLLGLLKYAVF